MSKSKKVKVGNVKVDKDTKDILERAMGEDKFERMASFFGAMVKEMRGKDDKEI